MLLVFVFSQCNNKKVYNKSKKALIVCLGFEPGPQNERMVDIDESHSYYQYEAAELHLKVLFKACFCQEMLIEEINLCSGGSSYWQFQTRFSY